jgi:hypothetical protein
VGDELVKPFNDPFKFISIASSKSKLYERRSSELKIPPEISLVYQILLKKKKPFFCISEIICFERSPL